MKTDTSIKYFLYARKSSEGEDQQVQSIPDQVNRLKKMADDYGLKIVDTLTEAHSAKAPLGRPVFNLMIDRIEKGEANGVLCWQTNRLFRNPVDAGRVQWLLQQGVIKSIRSIDGERKPDDNVLLLSVEAGVANQYIIDLRKNIKRGMDSKLEKGVMPCLAKTGYINEPYERTIVPDPDRYELVRKMWDLMLTGNYRPSQILKIATNEWGFRTRKTRRGGNKPLSMSGMYRVFSSLFYAGVIEYGGKQYSGIHNPMITLEEYDRVQVLLGRKGKPRPKKHSFAFTGLLKCEECGGFYTAEIHTKIIKKTGELKSFTYYHCTRKKRDINCTQKKHISLDDLEYQIEKELEQYTILPEFKDWALEVLNDKNDKEIEDRTKIYATQQKTINSTQAQLDNLTKMRYRDLIDDETFVKEKAVLQEQIIQLKGQLRGTEDRAEKWLELTERTFNFATYARTSFINGDTQTKKEILTALCSNPLMNNQKLLVSAENWFVRIKNDYEPLKQEYERLELGKEPMNKRQTAALATIRSRWWKCRESNPGQKSLNSAVDRLSCLVNYGGFCPYSNVKTGLFNIASLI